MMKKLLMGLLVGLWFVGTASAATVSTTLSVSATVGGACSVRTNPVVFTGYDGTYDVFGEGQIFIQCAPGVPYDIALDSGQNFGMDPIGSGYRAITDGSGNYVAYGLADPSGTREWGDSGYNDTYPYGLPVSGTATGIEDVLTVPGTIFSQGGPVPSGDYTDTVNVTVYF